MQRRPTGREPETGQLYEGASPEYRRRRSLRGTQVYQNRRKMLLGRSFPLANAAGKFRKPCFMRNEVSPPPFSSWSGFRSTEGVIFRSCPMVAESYFMNHKVQRDQKMNIHTDVWNSQIPITSLAEKEHFLSWPCPPRNEIFFLLTNHYFSQLKCYHILSFFLKYNY